MIKCGVIKISSEVNQLKTQILDAEMEMLDGKIESEVREPEPAKTATGMSGTEVSSTTTLAVNQDSGYDTDPSPRATPD